MLRLLNLVILFALTACTFKGTAVNHIEKFISYRLGNQLHLYYSQKRDLTMVTKKWILHQDQKLVISSAQSFLKEFEWKSADLESSYHQLSSYYRQLAYSFNNLLSQQLSLLDPDQQRKFFKTMKKGNQKLNKQESLRAGVERMLIFCFKDITDEQKQLIEQFYPDAQQVNTGRLERRLKSQEDIKSIFSQELSFDQRQKAIKAALDSAVNRPIEKHQFKHNLLFFNKLTQLLTAKQLTYFEKKKQDAREILALLEKRF